MERQIAECTTYKELAQVICDLIRFYDTNDYYDAQLARHIRDLGQDAQAHIDSYELDPDVEED